MNELNVLNFTNNEPPALSPLTKGLSNQNVGPKQSDILKVNPIKFYIQSYFFTVKLLKFGLFF